MKNDLFCNVGYNSFYSPTVLANTSVWEELFGRTGITAPLSEFPGLSGSSVIIHDIPVQRTLAIRFTTRNVPSGCLLYERAPQLMTLTTVVNPSLDLVIAKEPDVFENVFEEIGAFVNGSYNNEALGQICLVYSGKTLSKETSYFLNIRPHMDLKSQHGRNCSYWTIWLRNYFHPEFEHKFHPKDVIKYPRKHVSQSFGRIR